MSVSKKGRRRIVVANRLFWWNAQTHWGRIRCSEPTTDVHIVSDDKTLDVSYGLMQEKEKAELTVRRGVAGVPKEGGSILIPMNVDDAQATPRLVRHIIEWCLSRAPG